MLKRSILIPLILLCFSVSLSAEKLNVITGDPQSIIFVNGQNLGTEALYNYETLPGSYHIKIQNDGHTVFTKVVTVYHGEVTTIDTQHFVDVPKSNTPDLGPKRLAEKRLRLLKGNIGIGYQLGYVSGLSVTTIVQKIRVGIMGWQMPGNETQMSELRLSYALRDKLSLMGNLISLYSGVGIGSKKIGDDIDDSFSEIMIGVDMPAKYGYWNVEVGYGFISNKDNESNNGLVGKAGYHFYF